MRSKFVDYSEEKPPISDSYFVLGKKDYKAVIEYDSEREEWFLGNLPVNYFSNENIRWLKVIELPDLLSKLDEVINICDNNEESFEEKGLDYMSITSGAMASAYRNVRRWIVGE